MASTALVRQWYAEYECADEKMEATTFFGRGPVRVVPALVPAVAALEQALDDSGYVRSGGPIGSYYCRPIAGSTALSTHAYGVAIDIEYDVNPRWIGPALRPGWNTDPRCRITEANVQAVEAITNENGEQLWRWLGYIRNPDTMHFQINVPPDRAQPKETTMDLERWATRWRNPQDFDRAAEVGIITEAEAAYWKTVPTDSPEWQDLRDAVEVRSLLWT